MTKASGRVFDVCEMSFLIQLSTQVVFGGSRNAGEAPERRFLSISSWQRSEKYSESQEASAEKAFIQPWPWSRAPASSYSYAGQNGLGLFMC